MLLNLFDNPILLIAYLFAILFAITIHEYAHALAAYKLGDPTAKFSGRLSLNPVAHLDLWGTIMLLLVGFGWGKPVPVNHNNLSGKWDEVKISLAGPATNLLAAIILGLIARFLPSYNFLFDFLIITMQINIVLMAFNLLPIPPLDGASLLKAILPTDSYYTIKQMSGIIFFAFIIFMFSTPIISNYIYLVLNWLTRLIVG